MHYTTLTSPLIDIIGQQLYRIYRKITYGPRHAQFSSCFKKVSKEKGAMLDGTKTPKRQQKHGSCSPTACNKMAKPPWVYGRGLDTFYPRRACNSSKGRRMANTWTKEAICIGVDVLHAQLALRRLQNLA